MDQLIGSFSTNTKSRKWTMAVFSYLILPELIHKYCLRLIIIQIHDKLHLSSLADALVTPHLQTRNNSASVRKKIFWAKDNTATASTSMHGLWCGDRWRSHDPGGTEVMERKSNSEAEQHNLAAWWVSESFLDPRISPSPVPTTRTDVPLIVPYYVRELLLKK